jgi:hypothetical protein
MTDFDFFEWRDYGIAKGWISEPVCNTHEGPQLTEEEELEFEEGDPCVPVFRIWEESIAKDVA